jgi:hypothetical protein
VEGLLEIWCLLLAAMFMKICEAMMACGGILSVLVLGV